MSNIVQVFQYSWLLKTLTIIPIILLIHHLTKTNLIIIQEKNVVLPYQHTLPLEYLDK